MKFDISTKETMIKVIGVGGGGSNAVAHMFKQGIKGVDFAICNTDAQAMDNSPVMTKIELGPSLTEGRGAGSLPEVGKQACIESIEDVRKWLSDGTKMLFITAGMGGGTGTGAAPIIAKVAKEMEILTVGIVTLPFKFEGVRRQKQAFEGLEQLKKNVDSILVISNDKLREIYGNLTLSGAFGNADDILTIAAKGIAEIITVSGIINVDFEDVNTVMRSSGVAIMGSATKEGPDRAKKAIHEAINSPLLEDNDIRGAKHILLNITSGTTEVTMDELVEITEFIQEEAGYGTDLIWGHCIDDSLQDKLSITLIATGFVEGGQRRRQEMPKSEPTKVSLDEVRPNAIHRNEIEFIQDEIIDEIFDDIAEKPNTVEFDNKEVEKTMHMLNYKPSWTAHQEPFVKEDKGSKLTEELKKKQEADAARREYLRKTNSLPLDSPKVISDLENTPAYSRRNVLLDDTEKDKTKQVSKYTVNIDDGTVVMNNNSFLYDNVD